MKGWHFLSEDGTLRDGRDAPPDGEWLVHDGNLRMCSEGLHHSSRIIDALPYAPGPVLCRIEAGGEHLHQDDKTCSTERRILWRVRMPNELLRRFARRCALDVIHLWDPPDVVREYLETGDEELRAAAWDAARDAAWAAARDAAWAAGDAARDAAWAAAWDAARDAAWDAARDAAWDAGDAARDETLAAFNRRLTSMVVAEAKRQGTYRRDT